MANQIKEPSFDDLFDGADNLTSDITMSEISTQRDLNMLRNISNEMVFTVTNHTRVGKSLSDSVKSSPCSPTISFLNETEAAMPSQRQRSYSDSGDKLNPQDQAFLEELERGSQLTFEDEELFDLLSKKKFDGEHLMLSECESSRDSSSFNIVDRLCSNSQDSLQLETKGQSSIRNGSHGSSALKQLLLSNTTTKQKLPKVIKVTLNRGDNQIAKDSSIDDVKLASTAVSSISRSNTNDSTLTNTYKHADISADDALESNGSQPLYAIQFEDGISVKPISLFLPAGVTMKDGYIIFNNKEQQTGSPTLEPEQNTTDLKTSSSQNVVVDDCDKLYVCEDCGQSFSKPSKLNMHVMSKHTGERPFKCDHPGCNWAFTANYKLKRHIECHAKKKECMCPVEECGKLFSTVYNLNQHMMLHSRPKNFKCDVCGAAFGTRKKLDVHLKEHGEQCKTHKCPVEGCMKMFYSHLSMGTHLKSHERKTNFVCQYEGCSREFPQLCKLTAHERSHTNEKPYPCPYQMCNARFRNSSHVTRHMKTHTNQRNFTCQECGKAFMRGEHLRGHMTCHSGDRPHVCWFPDCKAAFSAKSTLYVHMKRHPQCDRSPHVCPLESCEERFNDKTSLRRHIDRHYGRDSVEEQKPKEKRQKINAVSSVPLPLVTLTLPIESEPSIDTMEFLNVTVAKNADEPGELLIRPELAHSLLTASGISMVNNDYLKPEQAQQMVESGHAVLELLQAKDECGDSTEGCARTDYHRNHLMSVNIRKRRMILKQKAAQAGYDIASFQDIANTSRLVSSTITDSSDTGPLMNPNEVMTSRAITIRDPETGAVYVQTQLLQDDPPNMEFEETGVENPGSGKSLLDYRAIIQDANFSQTRTLNSANENSILFNGLSYVDTVPSGLDSKTNISTQPVIWDTVADVDKSQLVTYSIINDCDISQNFAVMGTDEDDTHTAGLGVSDTGLSVGVVSADEVSASTYILQQLQQGTVQM